MQLNFIKLKKLNGPRGHSNRVMILSCKYGDVQGFGLPSRHHYYLVSY